MTSSRTSRRGRRHYRVTLADALAGHEDGLRVGGGSPGINSLPGLLSALARPYSGYYSNIHRKAAALIESVCQNHPFTDGNKRTSLYLLNVLLERSGYCMPTQHAHALGDMIVEVAKGELKFSGIVAFLEAHVERLG